MPINGWYNTINNNDNVTDDGNIDGWADQSGQAYNGVNGNNIANGSSYRFGNIINNYGTWGQLIYAGAGNLAAPDMGNPTGLNGNMPPNNNIPGNSNWVQGHLINGDCGGSGALTANLTPITHNLNMLHAGYEAVVQRLVNRGAATGAMQIMFNPNNIQNTRLIYRTQAVAPPVTVNQVNVPAPAGIVVSIGFVINGVMKTAQQVLNEFQNPGQNRWFGGFYYGNGAQANNDRDRIIAMIGGVLLEY